MNYRNTKDTMISFREIYNTGWLQYCMVKDYLKPGDLYLIHDFSHHNKPTPNKAPYFNVFCVGVNESWYVVDLFVCSKNRVWKYDKWIGSKCVRKANLWGDYT